MDMHIYQEDLPEHLNFDGKAVAIDTEAMGLNNYRDRLCLVQLSVGDGTSHLIQFSNNSTFAAPRLKALLTNADILKIFHFARFDVAILQHYLKVSVNSLYCTKIASKLVRTYTDRHGLKDLCRDLLGVEVSKGEQSSDWGADQLKPEQLKYAATDVLHLHALKARLDTMLKREGRSQLAQGCFDFLPIRVQLDLAGWPEIDIFQH